MTRHLTSRVWIATMACVALAAGAGCRTGQRGDAPSPAGEATRVARDASSVQVLLLRYDSVIVGRVTGETEMRGWPVFAFDVTRVIAAQAEAPGRSIQVRRLGSPLDDVFDPSKPWPGLDVGGQYLLITAQRFVGGDRPPGEPFDVRLFRGYAIGDDGRLRPLESDWSRCAGASALAGLTIDEAAELVRAALALPSPTPVSPVPVTPAPATPVPTPTPSMAPMPPEPPPTWTSSPTATVTPTRTPGPSATPTSTATSAGTATPEPSATATPVPTVATPVSNCW